MRRSFCTNKREAFHKEGVKSCWILHIIIECLCEVHIIWSFLKNYVISVSFYVMELIFYVIHRYFYMMRADFYMIKVSKCKLLSFSRQVALALTLYLCIFSGSATFTSCLPVFSPVNKPKKASIVFSKPSTIFSL